METDHVDAALAEIEMMAKNSCEQEQRLLELQQEAVA